MYFHSFFLSPAFENCLLRSFRLTLMVDDDDYDDDDGGLSKRVNNKFSYFVV
jgi:hypothetical protein